MKIAITGATGFIGSHLVNRLVKENHDVLILCRKSSDLNSLNSVINKIRICRCDDNINQVISAFNEFNPKYVIHLAAFFKSDHKKDDIDKFIDSNIKYPSIILEAMRQCGVKNFINTGTAWQHYNNEEYNPVCLYAATKESFEKIIDYYTKALGLRCITLKLFDSYGDNDNRGKLISVLKKCAENNIDLNMTEGNCKIDLTHVDDIVNGFIKAVEYMEYLENGSHAKYVLCTERLLSLKEVIEIFENKTGYKLKVNWNSRKYGYRKIIVPWNKYEILPNWKSEISFEEGIERLCCK